jgi:hypothetical protein
MRHFFGIVHLSPYKLLQLFKGMDEIDPKLAAKFRPEVVFPQQGEYSGDKSVVIAVGHRSFERIKDKIDSKTTVFLVESPVLCSRYKDIRLLDVAVQEKSYIFRFCDLTSEALLQALQSPKVKQDVTAEPIDVISTLLQDAPSSALQYIQTFVYKIGDTDKRGRYQYDIFNTIKEGKPFKSLSWYNPKVRSHIALNEWWESEDGARILHILHKCLNMRETEDKAIPYKQIEKQYGVCSFDLKYALSILRKSSKYEEVDKTTRELFDERKSGIKTRRNVDEPVKRKRSK